jgi:superfamily II DNA or RNA helicase
VKLKPIPGPLPQRLEIVLAQRCFVATHGLPPALIDRLRRLAAFANPEFHRKQAMRMPTNQVPRIIACAALDGEFVSLPRANVAAVEDLAAALGIPVSVTDKRNGGDPFVPAFEATLRPTQRYAVDAMLAHDFGILVSPPGSGKTVMGAALVAARQRNTLVLVHTQPLVEQWRAQLAKFLGLEANEIGVISGGKRKVTGRLDVATLQSLTHGEEVDDIVALYGHVLVDESHHVPAVSFERVLSAVRATFVTGLTATPRRRDGLHPIAEMQLGPVRHVVALPQESAEEAVNRRLVVRPTGLQPESLPRDASIQEVYAALARHDGRNRQIAADVIVAVLAGRRVLVLTERTEQLNWLADYLIQQEIGVVALHGKLKVKQRKHALAAWRDPAGSVGRVLIATGRYVGEGFDDPLLDTLVMASPVSWRGTLVQYVGRLTRESPGKREIVVYDYIDAEVAVLRRMFERRRAGYRSLGFAPVEPLPQPRAW